VKMQIQKLKEPTLKCIDMVVSELTSTIQKCSQQVKCQRALRHFDYLFNGRGAGRPMAGHSSIEMYEREEQA